MSTPRLLLRETQREKGGALPRPGVPDPRVQLGAGPRPEWVVGTCPLCGGPLVRNNYYVGGKGLMLIEECWGALSFPAECSHRQRL